MTGPYQVGPSPYKSGRKFGMTHVIKRPAVQVRMGMNPCIELAGAANTGVKRWRPLPGALAAESLGSLASVRDMR